MKKIQKLMNEIVQITSNIESNYPELHRHLNETPITIGDCGPDEICTEDLENYLESLKKQLLNHIQTHKVKK
jgi:hypothetical protein